VEKLEVTAQQDGVLLTVWVQPRSSRDEVIGVQGEIKIHGLSPQEIDMLIRRSGP